MVRLAEAKIIQMPKMTISYTCRANRDSHNTTLITALHIPNIEMYLYTGQ